MLTTKPRPPVRRVTFGTPRQKEMTALPTSHRPLWRAYESQIYQSLLAEVPPSAEVRFDTTLPGRFSGIERQIDVLVTDIFAGLEKHQMIVDCKCFSRPIDVIHVEAFAGLLDDVNIPLGRLVTNRGFTEAARRRARHVREAVLEVIEIDDFELLSRIRPCIGYTDGADQATVSYFDGVENITRTITPQLAKRLFQQIAPDIAGRIVLPHHEPIATHEDPPAV